MSIPGLDAIRRLPRARALIIGAVFVGTLAIIIGAYFLPAGATGGASEQAAGGEAEVTSSATAPPQPTATSEPVSAGLVTPVPASDSSATLSAADLADRGVGVPGTAAFRGARMVIPAIGVDAPLTVRIVAEDGKMPNPKGPADVAWYDFSRWPGLGGAPGAAGNAVFAGHVDYINYGPAVFWNLRDLASGDEVRVVLDDGSELRYVVQWNRSTPADEADWTAIVRATGQESITLITCAGQFDQASRQYDERIIVWATRA